MAPIVPDPKAMKSFRTKAAFKAVFPFDLSQPFV